MSEHTKIQGWIAVVAAGTLALVLCRLFGLDGLTVPAKMTASSGFVGLAITAGALKSRYGQILLAGLLLSWIGDLLLTGTSERSFLFGLVSFLAAHLAYIGAFANRGLNRRWCLVAAVPVGIASTVAAIWLTPFVPPGLTAPVWVYTAVISLMVIAAAGARGAGAPWLVLPGAVLFYLSDLSVAAGQFVQPDFPNYVWGLPFYFGGQVMLALSAARPPAG